MKISYDPEVDALSIVFRETTVTTQELAEMFLTARRKPTGGSEQRHAQHVDRAR